VIWFAGAIVACGLVSTGVSASRPDQTTREFRYLMGTSVAIEVSGGDAAHHHDALDEAFGAIAEVDRLMSNYRDDSELAQVNRLASTQLVPLSDPLYSVLRAAARVSAASAGAFDVTVGPAVRLWGIHDHKPHLPTDHELDTIRPLVDYRNVLLDPDRKAVRFRRTGVEVDLGGIAKGFAVEVAANTLRKRGLNAFIDAGGNQYLLGHPPGRNYWTTGIRNAEGGEGLLGALDTGETSISTSADYANFVEIDGRKYGHIVDPRTLRPSTASLSATVVMRDATMADALSKAAFLLGPKAGLQLIDGIPGAVAVIAYRRGDGGIGIARSASLRTGFRPTDARVTIDR
jgi:thiamine biosynthesis lipoprotein